MSRSYTSSPSQAPPWRVAGLLYMNIYFFSFLHQFILMYYNNKQRYHGSKAQWLLCLRQGLLSCKLWTFAFLLSCGTVCVIECIIYVVGAQVCDRNTHWSHCSARHDTAHTTTGLGRLLLTKSYL
jgi:fatty acid desaturase